MDQGGEQKPEASRAPGRNPAASMSLLQVILDSALDPGYRQAADTQRGRLPLWRQIVVGVVVAALACGMVLAVKNLRFVEGQQMQVRSQMLTQVTEQQDSMEGLAETVDELDMRLQERTEDLSVQSGLIATEGSALASFAAVTGPGVRVTIEDSSVTDDSAKGIVKDSDIRTIVNLLWESRAEAIAVNGVRLGPTTTIRTAGDVILVDLQSVESPYIIEAIGDSAAAYAFLTTGSGEAELTSLSSSRSLPLTIDRAEGLSLPSTAVHTTGTIDSLEGKVDES